MKSFKANMGPRVCQFKAGSAALMLFVLLLCFTGNHVAALNIEYCSNDNTGSGNAEFNSIWQSNGACFDNCKADWAFAILQGSSCWCSNYIPAGTTSTGDCNQNCPGYPDDKCGSSSSSLFGYIALNKSPSGTAGAASSSTSSSNTPSSTAQSSTSQASSPKPSSSPSPETVFQTVTASPSVLTSVLTPSTTSTSSPSSTPTTPSTTPSSTSQSPTPTSTTSTTPTSSSSSSTSTWSATPVTTIMTVTGQVKTVTMTPTQPPVAASEKKESNGGFFSHAGKVAGLFTGIALIIILIVGSVIYSYWRRRHQDPEMLTGDSTTTDDNSRRPSRAMSESGLLSGFKSEKVPPPIHTSSFGSGVIRGSPDHSPDGKVPHIVDQRLDPTTFWRYHDNSSRVSVRSLRDDQDYSRRVLRLANPDQDPA